MGLFFLGRQNLRFVYATKLNFWEKLVCQSIGYITSPLYIYFRCALFSHASNAQPLFK